MSSTDDKKQRLSIQYPVGVCQEPEGEPDVETTLVIRDASGRDLDVEEIADALNNARETNSLLVGSPLSATPESSDKEQKEWPDGVTPPNDEAIQPPFSIGGPPGWRCVVDSNDRALTEAEIAERLNTLERELAMMTEAHETCKRCFAEAERNLSATRDSVIEECAKIIDRKGQDLTNEYCHGDAGPDGYTWDNKEAEWQVILLGELVEEFRALKSSYVGKKK